jgi:hypothetical protein
MAHCQHPALLPLLLPLLLSVAVVRHPWRLCPCQQHPC